MDWKNIVISILIFSIAGFLVYWFVHSNIEKLEEIDENIEEDSTEDIASEWLDYENVKYGFRLKYPVGWKIKEEAIEDDNRSLKDYNADYSIWFDSPDLGDGARTSIVLDILEDPPAYSFADYHMHMINSEIIEERDIEIPETDAIHVITDTLSGKREYIYFYGQGRLHSNFYSFYNGYPIEEQEYSEIVSDIFSKIVDSFQYQKGLLEGLKKEDIVCNYMSYEIPNSSYTPEGGNRRFEVRTADKIGFSCIYPGPYFNCGEYLFGCDEDIIDFDCSQYKNRTDEEVIDEIETALKNAGYHCDNPYQKYFANINPKGYDYATFGLSPERLEEQLSILKEAELARIMTTELEEKFLHDLYLFKGWGCLCNVYVGLFYHPRLGIQGIRWVAYEGTDVDISNHRYKAAFIKDGKLYHIDWWFFSDLESHKKIEEQFEYYGIEPFTEELIRSAEDKDENSLVYQELKKNDLLLESVDFLGIENMSF